jgi:adenine-specific DNA-methyltransferase
VHFDGSRTRWPVPESKKANALRLTPETARMLYPTGIYVAVRRFSSKEEKRRVVASLVRPEDLNHPEAIGFENHLNVFHANKRGLPEDLAWGLFVFLNSTVLDEHLRRFSGHTQVNATDLRNIRYPDRARLEALGRWAKTAPELQPADIDQRMDALLA